MFDNKRITSTKWINNKELDGMVLKREFKWERD